MKLLQKRDAVVEELSQILHPVTQHGKTFHAQPEGKALETGRIQSGVTKHLRMHHAAAQHLQPARLIARALPPGHVDFGGRLGERKVRRTKAQPQVIAFEKGPQKARQQAFEIGKAAALCDIQPLDLVEHGAVGLVRIAAVHFSPGR